MSVILRERELRFLFILRERAEIVHTQGERAEIVNLSLSKDRVFQPGVVLSLLRSKGKLAQWIENDKTYHNDMIGPQNDTLELFVPKLTL